MVTAQRETHAANYNVLCYVETKLNHTVHGSMFNKHSTIRF